MFDTYNHCVVCGQGSKLLCRKHIKFYRYVPEYYFYALKPFKSISGPQTSLFANVRDLYHLPTYQEVIFEFNLVRRYDIVIPDLKLILEYDGKQHFEFCKLFHKTKERFEQSKEDEIIKENAARGNGYKLIRFSYIEDVEDRIYIERKLKLKGVDKSNG